MELTQNREREREKCTKMTKQKVRNLSVEGKRNNTAGITLSDLSRYISRYISLGCIVYGTSMCGANSVVSKNSDVLFKNYVCVCVTKKVKKKFKKRTFICLFASVYNLAHQI
uniref:Uncharacterized protein n=1 Tax=Anguilla anguilla TaxID=7936 RepID=A0A0E9XQW5_ANGAN